MKRSALWIFTLIIFMVSCGKSEKPVIQDDPNKTCVEILYFHGDMVCRNCVAMEKGISELLDNQYKEDVKAGRIIFKTVDITTPEGEEIADKYGVTWSSLFINNWKEGQEERNDLTRMGMRYAAKDPETFKKEIANYIQGYLN